MKSQKASESALGVAAIEQAPSVPKNHPQYVFWKDVEDNEPAFRNLTS